MSALEAETLLTHIPELGIDPPKKTCCPKKWKTTLMAEERQLRADIVTSAGLYYIDFATDMKTCVTFIRKGKYMYFASIVGSIIVNVLVSYFAGSEVEASKYSVFGPLVIALRALRYKASSSADKKTWDDAAIRESHQVVAELRDLRTQLQQLTSHEATIESPINTMVQLMAATNMHQRHQTLTSDELWLWFSVIIGCASMAKSLVAWESYGRVHMKKGSFKYVVGTCQSTCTLVGVAFFRLLEITSRLLSFVALHEAVVAALPVWWSHYLLPIYMAMVCLVLLCIGMGSRPCRHQHLVLCLPAVFIFPGPLVLPPRVKAACTSARTHIVLRIVESIAILVFVMWLMDFDVQKACSIAGTTFFAAGAVLTCTFSAAGACLVITMSYQTHDEAALILASQLLGTESRRVQSFKWPTDQDLVAALMSYGIGLKDVLPSLPPLEEPRKDGSHFVDFYEINNLKTDELFQTWLNCQKKSAPVLDFIQAIQDDHEAAKVAGVLHLFTSAKEACFACSPSLSAGAWRGILQALSPTVDHFSIRDCRFDDDQAEVFVEALPRFALVTSVKMSDGNNVSKRMRAAIVLQMVQLFGTDTECKFEGEDGEEDSGVPLVTELVSAATLDFNPAKHKTFRNANFSWLRAASPECVVIRGRQSYETLDSVLANLDAANVQDFTIGPENMRANTEAYVLRDLPRFLILKKANFRGNRGLSGTAWQKLLQLLSPRIQEFDFSLCDLADEDKADAVAKGLQRFSALKTVSFASNANNRTRSFISGTGWQKLLESLSTSVSEFDFTNCALNDEKAEVFAKVLKRFSNLKKVDFRKNKPGFTEEMQNSLTSSYPHVTLLMSKATGPQKEREPDMIRVDPVTGKVGLVTFD